MGDTLTKKDEESDPKGTEEEEGSENPEEQGTVAVESKTVGYVIMNPDFYKEPKAEVRITGPSDAYEYVTRKPRGGR